MIKVDNIDTNDILTLWRESFGDTNEDILFFVNSVKNAKCILYYVADNPAAMLYLVDCRIKGISSKYIYAACTSCDYRNNGYMTKLLDFVKHNYNDVCLIPAENWLIDYYKQRDFTDMLKIDLIDFNESKEIIEYLFEGCELEEPFALRYKGV